MYRDQVLVGIIFTLSLQPGINPDVRRKLGEAAVRAAQAVKYMGAGMSKLPHKNDLMSGDKKDMHQAPRCFHRICSKKYTLKEQTFPNQYFT